MDTTQMMMASGGMLSILVGLLMMLLPFILLLIAWRILKWSATTAQQVTRLTDQMDALLQQLQGNAASVTPTNDFSLDTTADTATEETDDFDILAAAPATAADSDADDFSAAADSGPDTNPYADDSEGDETGFEFPMDENEAFGGLDEPDDNLEPAAEALDTLSPADADSDAKDEDFDFDIDEEEAEDDSFAAADLDQATEEEEDDFFSAAAEQQDPLAGAFDTDIAETTDSAADSPATEEAADEAAESETEEEERRMEESFDSAFPPSGADAEEPAQEEAAQEPPAEEPPAIIRLDDDPARPEVSLARCGQCDHKLAYKKTLAGKKARCPSCKGAFILP